MSAGVSFTENTSNFDALVKDHSELKKIEAFIGILGQKASKNHQGSSFSNVQIGEVHEFGAPGANIPERSFLRQAMDSNPNKVTKFLIEAYLSVLEGKSADKAMKLVGERCRGLVLEQFKQGGDPSWPDIKEATKRRKGSDAILIDTGQLRASIQSETRKRGF